MYDVPSVFKKGDGNSYLFKIVVLVWGENQVVFYQKILWVVGRKDNYVIIWLVVQQFFFWEISSIFDFDCLATAAASHDEERKKVKSNVTASNTR